LPSIRFLGSSLTVSRFGVQFQSRASQCCNENPVIGKLRVKDFQQRQPVGNIKVDEDIVQKKDLAGYVLRMAFDHTKIDMATAENRASFKTGEAF
jgi:hypothetical protein